MQSAKEIIEESVRRLERTRIRRHLSAVEAELRGKDIQGLSPELRARRAAHLNRLHAYCTAGRFPMNTHIRQRRVPVFVDGQGTPCAVAALMIQAGNAGLVNDVATSDNHVRIRDACDGPVLDWLEGEGLTKEEAARIQPSYSPQLDFQIFVTILFAVFLPMKLVVDLIWRGITVRARGRWGTMSAVGLATATPLAAIAIGVGAAAVLQPTNEPYAAIYRTALVLSFLVTLLPLEIAALWALSHGEPRQRWRAISPYLGLVNVGVATFLALFIVPFFAAFLG